MDQSILSAYCDPSPMISVYGFIMLRAETLTLLLQLSNALVNDDIPASGYSDGNIELAKKIVDSLSVPKASNNYIL